MALEYVYLLAILNMKYYHPEDPGHINVYISGYQDTEIEYLLPWEEDSKKVVLNEQNGRAWEKTIQLRPSQETTAQHKGIRVISPHPITIQVSRGKLQLTNTAAYTALPLTDDSKEFILSAQRNSPSGLANSQSIFTIGAGRQGAIVSIYDNKTDSPSLLFVRTLSSYEMLEIPSGQEDITGIYLRSDRPIVTYSGHQCGNIPVSVNFCEPLFQQVPALPLVGTEYVMGPIMQRDKAGYTARVIVTETNTDIVLAMNTGRMTLTFSNIRRGCNLRNIGNDLIYNVECSSPLKVGSYLEFHVTPSTSPLVIKCSSSCYVYQMNHGGTQPVLGVNTDPFMALVPPLGQKVAITRFATISSFTSGRELIYRNFVSIIAPKEKEISFDDEVLSADEAYIAGDYMVYYMEIQYGFHEVRARDGKATNLVVQAYGHGPSAAGSSFSGQSAYGMPGTYFSPGLHAPDITFGTMTSTATSSTMKTTSTTVSTDADDLDVVSDVNQPIGSDSSETSAITTGILTAITVVIIIVVTCAIIIAIVVVALRNRRRKNNQDQVINDYVNATNAAVFLEAGTNGKTVAKSVPVVTGPVKASAPQISNNKGSSSASPPKYEDVYNEIGPVYDFTGKSNGQDLYGYLEPGGEDTMEYENVGDAATFKDNTYEGLNDGKQWENTYDRLEQPRA